MNYKEATEAIKRRYTVADGYAGKTANVGLSFLQAGDARGIAVEVSTSGYYRANEYDYVNEEEMLYFFDNHAKTHFRQILKKEEV